MSVHIFLNSTCGLSRINITAGSTLLVGLVVSLTYSSSVPQKNHSDFPRVFNVLQNSTTALCQIPERLPALGKELLPPFVGNSFRV